MAKPQTANRIARNMALSLSAQMISLVVSFLMGFIVPKYIDEFQYAYWQTYLLYVTYVGLFHFGLLDGIVLRYSRYDYEELDHARIRSQFQLLLGGTSAFFLIGLFLASVLMGGVDREIMILVSLGVITKNILSYTSFSFQITNRISNYAAIVILQRMTYAVVVVGLLLGRVESFVFYCVADLLGDLVGTLVGSLYNRGLYFGRGLSLRETFIEGGKNISSGIFLMVANFSSIFLLGGAKMVAEWRFDELTFGRVAFAFSLANIFLTCITAVSVVLFPSLKRMNADELPSFYLKIRGGLSPLLFFVLLGYFPLSFILRIWLPNYAVSLVYLGILLPVIIFSSKVNLLTNNYLKAYRRERSLLFVNLITVAFGFAIFLLAAYALHSLDMLLYAVVLIALVNSVASECLVMRVIHVRVYRDIIIELFMAVAFILAAKIASLFFGFLVYLACFAIYLLFYRKSVGALLSRFLLRKGQ